MTDSHDDTALQIGRMDGRLSALESRIDRHESYVTQKLTLIEDKLDRALLVQAQGTAIARTLHWCIAALLTVAGWFAGRFTIGGGH